MKKINKLFIVLVSLGIILVSVIFISKSRNNLDNNSSSGINIVEKDNESNLEIVDKEEASYEEWLAAAMIKALTLQEDEFQIEHIYYKNNTAIDNKMDSDGVYIVYSVDDEICCKYSKPLEKEDTHKGKVNLYTKDLGFATYDQIKYNDLKFHSYNEISMDNLSALISQSLLVSLYEN